MHMAERIRPPPAAAAAAKEEIHAQVDMAAFAAVDSREIKRHRIHADGTTRCLAILRTLVLLFTFCCTKKSAWSVIYFVRAASRAIQPGLSFCVLRLMAAIHAIRLTGVLSERDDAVQRFCREAIIDSMPAHAHAVSARPPFHTDAVCS
jgi:hypothetical protein